MATENLKSVAITNAEATPVVLNAGRVVRAQVFQGLGIVEAAGGDAGSTYRAVRVPSNAFGIKVELATDDLGTGVTLDVGLYDVPTVNSGAVVDADFFASAVDVATAAVAPTNVTHESGVYGIEDVEKPLWEALGLSADPVKLYDITGTSNSAAATGTIMFRVSYVT